MDNDTLLLVYKSLRLPILVLAITFIIMYVYSRKKRDKMEEPKYRMLEED